MSGKYLVLVDSSIWIDFFRNGNSSQIEDLIKEDLVCTNEMILTELLPSLEQLGHHEVIESLLHLQRIPLNIDWDIIRKYQLSNLKSGINKVGIPDLIILQQVIQEKLTLMTLDKHFHLMQQTFQFDIIES